MDRHAHENESLTSQYDEVRRRACCLVDKLGKFIKNNLMLILTFGGIIAGFALGFGIRETQPSKDVLMWIGIPGELFLRMLKLLILPLIVCSVISSSAALDPKANGKISAVSFAYIIITNILACILGVVLSIIMKPGVGGIMSTEIKENALIETQDIFVDLLSGEAEVITDQASHKAQYPEIWEELQRLLPDLLPRDNGINYTPYESLQRRRSCHRPYQMCLLGDNEVVGAVEVILGLKTYLETTIVTRESQVLVLSTNNYNRLFNRKSSSRSVDMLKEMLCQRYYLYIHRSNLSVIDASFLKYLTIKMLDIESIKLLKSRHRKKQEFTEQDFYEAYRIFKKMEKENNSILNLMKILDINFLFFDTTLPELETSKKVLTDLETRMTQWRIRSKGDDRPESGKYVKNGNQRRKSCPEVLRRSLSSANSKSSKPGTPKQKSSHL